MWGTLKQRERVKEIILRQIERGPTTVEQLLNSDRRHEVTAEIIQALLATGKIIRDAQGYLRANTPSPKS
jgi:hypothetical protein